MATAAVTGAQVLIDAERAARRPALLGPLQAGHRDDGGAQRGRAEAAAGDVRRTRDDEQGVRQYGLIAEEVAAVYPELVTRTATGEVQAVRYQELIPMLVNELQRQQVERQQHVTEHLQRELAELRSLVGQMRGGMRAAVEASRPGVSERAPLPQPAASPMMGPMVMDRRAFLASTVLVLAGPLGAEAQPAGKMWRIGVLTLSVAFSMPAFQAFRQGLRDQGYVEGQNMTLELRFANGKPRKAR